MKHTSTRALYSYWNKQRGSRPAPERGDIDPISIRHELGDVFMLAADFVDQLRFRLAGTRVCALFNREIKGETFAGLWDDSSAKTIEQVVAALNDERIGVVAGLVGRAVDGATVHLELILLPLAHTGHARIRAIGALVALAPPYWLGERPVTELRLTALRHIGTDSDSIDGRQFTLAPAQQPQIMQDPQEIMPAPEGSRVKHGFVVYSGGRQTPSDEKIG